MHEKNNKITGGCLKTERPEKHIYFDLDINEVAMMIHSFLKKFAVGYQTINYYVEEVAYETLAIPESESHKKTYKYTLIIIASMEHITNKELIKLFEEIMRNSSFGKVRA